MHLTFLILCGNFCFLEANMQFFESKNLIKKDEKMFIVCKFDNFFYRELAVDARAIFFRNNFDTEERSISIYISSKKIDVDELFIRFGDVWSMHKEKEIIIETMAFRKELCSLECTINLLLILCEIAEKFNYRTIRFVRPTWVGDYICLKFGFSADRAKDLNALNLALKGYLLS
jgi:hypothetical protein